MVTSFTTTFVTLNRINADCILITNIPRLYALVHVYTTGRIDVKDDVIHEATFAWGSCLVKRYIQASRIKQSNLACHRTLITVWFLHSHKYQGLSSWMRCFWCHFEQNRTKIRTIKIFRRNHIFSPQCLIKAVHYAYNVSL